MIDGSKKHKSLAGVEVQSPYVIERRSKHLYSRNFTRKLETIEGVRGIRS